MTSVKMLLSYNNNEKVVQLPVVPDELPDIVQQLANTEFETHTRTLTLLGNKKPRTFSLELFLPTQKYSFAASSNAEEVISLIEYVCEAKIPARLVIVDNLTELLNIAVSVSSYQYRYDTVGNIRASISLSEYMFVSYETEESSEDTVIFGTTLIRLGVSGVTVKSTNVDGHILVYARDVLEYLGRTVGWNAEQKKVISDGETLDIHTEIYDGRAFVYIRELAEALGFNVEWNSSDKSVTLC